MKKAYVSFLPDWAELKKKLPFGSRWPMPLLAGLASVTSLVRGPELPVLDENQEAQERPLWMMSPWPETEGSRLEAARLRRMTLSGLAKHRVQKAVLSGPLLKAGGGLEVWRAETGNKPEACGRISDGMLYNISGVMICLLKEPPRRTLLIGSGPVLTEMAGMLARHGKSLTVCGRPSHWTALELLRAELIYELGTVMELTPRPGIEDYKQAELLLVTDAMDGTAFLEQGLAVMNPGSRIWDLTPEGAIARRQYPHLNIRRLARAARAPDFYQPACMLECLLPEFESLNAAMEAANRFHFYFPGKPPV
jgi:hypothetical protein